MPSILELMQRRQGCIGIVQHHRLGDLQFKPVGRQTGFPQCGDGGGNKIMALELHGRQIDCDLQLARPIGRGRTCLPQHPLADRHDHAGLFGKGYELVGRNETSGRMPPAQQRFETGDPLGPKVDQRLIEQLELAGTQRLMEVEFHDTARLHPRIHFGMKQSKDTAPIGLRPIQGQVGTFQQLIGFQSVLRCERYADAGANDDLMLGDLEWLREHLDHALGEPDCVEWRLDRGLQDGEFVAAKPGNRVSLPQAISRRSATACSSRSPIGCPSVSFTALN